MACADTAVVNSRRGAVEAGGQLAGATKENKT
jgi:hypothetical protein